MIKIPNCNTKMEKRIEIMRDEISISNEGSFGNNVMNRKERNAERMHIVSQREIAFSKRNSVTKPPWKISKNTKI